MKKSRQSAYLLIADKGRSKEAEGAFRRTVDGLCRIHGQRHVDTVSFEKSGGALKEKIDASTSKGVNNIFIVFPAPFRSSVGKQSLPIGIRTAKRRHPEIDFHFLSVPARSVRRKDRSQP